MYGSGREGLLTVGKLLGATPNVREALLDVEEPLPDVR